MKKSLVLVILTAIVLVGCGREKKAEAPMINHNVSAIVENSIEEISESVDEISDEVKEVPENENRVDELSTTEDANQDESVDENTDDIEVQGIERMTMYSTTKVNIRNGAGTDCTIIGGLSFGDEVTVVGESGDWSKIEFDGSDAYVNSKYLQADKPVPAAVVNETVSAENLPSTTLCTGTAKEIFDATNAERAAAGLPALVWSDELAIAADIRAEEIINNFSHVRPNGQKCYSLGSNVHGENIARGPHANGSEFVAHWMASEGHKANILRAEVYTAIGIGTRCTEMGDTAVQIFGTY